MIHDEALLLVHQAEQMGGEKKLQIEGWIFAHEDDVETL